MSIRLAHRIAVDAQKTAKVTYVDGPLSCAYRDCW